MAHVNEQPTAPVEVVAGEVIRGLSELALRFVKRDHGEQAALAALSQLEAGDAQLLVGIVVRADGTHLVAHLQRGDELLPAMDMTIVPQRRTH